MLSLQIRSHAPFYSLFQHYKLYQFLFNRKQRQITNKIDVLVESIADSFVGQPPPLEDGLEERLYFKYIKPHPSPEKDFASRQQSTQVAKQENENDGPATTEELLCDSCQENEPKEDSPIEKLSLNHNLTELLKRMTVDDIKSLVASIAEEKLNPLKMELNSKMKERETVLLTKMKKLQTN